MFRPIMIAVAAAALITAGAATAFAANSHGKAVSNLAATTTLRGAAKGDAISVLASAKGETTSDKAKTEATADAADRDNEADTDATTNESTDNASGDKDAHGDAVSAVAKSDATAAHQDGAKKVNHGGAVSAVAQKH
jgi:hypothetical protein